MDRKIVQYLREAHAMEQALVRVLQSQIAIAPSGSYRQGLEAHLLETRTHAERVSRRLSALHRGINPIASGIGLLQTLAGQALALGKAPLGLLRGSSGEETLLKNTKDACATEAFEIATYTALERLARSVADRETAELAGSIRADEERMLERLTRELPKLADALLAANGRGTPPHKLAQTGSNDSARRPGKPAKKRDRGARPGESGPARQARKAPAGRTRGTKDGAAPSA